MADLIKKIKQLESISRQLEPGPDERAKWNAEVQAYADRFLDQLDTLKAYIPDTGQKESNPFTITEEASELPELLRKVQKDIDDVGLNPASGGYLGYIPGGGLYPSALGDYLAAVSNRYAGVFFGAPGAVRLENSLIRWMCDLMGFPEDAAGNLTSGGSISNLVAVVAAREAMQIKARDVEKCVIYLTGQAHHSIQKAIRIAGLSEAVQRTIPVDAHYRMDARILRQNVELDIKNGLKPFLINTSFGTTNTGAVDPVAAIADIAEAHGIWLHVDAAYGGFFKLLPSFKEKFKGVERADSITLDPHKTLFLPFGTGAVLVRDKKYLTDVFYSIADYMQDTVKADVELSPADVSPELTKHFRGLRMWLPLKLFGLKPFRAALEEKIHLTRYFYNEIGKINGFERGPEPELSVTMFRYIPEKTPANLFNEKLIEKIQQDGRIFLSSTTINGIFWIRVAIVVFRVHLEHIDKLIGIIQEKRDELFSEGLS